MKIGLIDADLLDKGTRHPNLVLLKLSAYYKELGNDVELIESYSDVEEYDKLVMSKVFNFSKVPDHILEFENIEYGGTGFFPDGGPDLPYEIEHHMPDYSLYDEYVERQINKGASRTKYIDYLEFSIGFATRGCFRKCDFCVNKKYDHVFRHAKINEFLDQDRKRIYLWDDNILAFPKWKEVFSELSETKKSFQFRQGMDIRLMTEEKAEIISKSNYYGDFIFAFDHIEDRELIERKLRLWKKHCKKTTKLYVLCAYESQDIHDVINTLERIKILMKCGSNPYIMRYESYKDSPMKGMYTQLARWCNQPQFYKKKSFRQFCEANQEYHKNPNTYCASYRVLLEFEKKYPEVASEYFDLRYEDMIEV